MRDDSIRCQGCREGVPLGFDFLMAFQPIVDLDADAVWGYEALVRGTEGQSAASILGQVNDENRYRFDQACRVKAIEAAGRLFGRNPLRLSINFLPNAVYEPAACIRTSLAAAERVGFAREQIMFEFTENEKMADVARVTHIVNEYRRFGFLTAIDDFGAGHSGLNLLAAFQPDLLKLDMDLIRDIDSQKRRQAIVRGLVGVAKELNIVLIAEGVETESECVALREMGLHLFQGYHFARPALNALPSIERFTPRAAA